MTNPRKPHPSHPVSVLTQATGDATATASGSVTTPAPVAIPVPITATVGDATGTATASGTVIPSGTGSGLSGLALVSDDFTHYQSTADLLANISSNIGGTGTPGMVLYGDGANASLVSLDPSVLYNGHSTMKYEQPDGVETSPHLEVYFKGQTVKSLWYRTKIRFSPGWTTVGTGFTIVGTNPDGTPMLSPSAAAYKLLGFGWSGYDGSGRVEITNTNQYQLYYDVIKNGSVVSTLVGPYGFAGNVVNEWTDGAWYDYIVQIDFSAPVGVARLWMAQDGQAPALRATSQSQMTDGSPMPLLNRVILGLNFNQVRTQAQALWYGEWEVVDGSAHPNPYGL